MWLDERWKMPPRKVAQQLGYTKKNPLNRGTTYFSMIEASPIHPTVYGLGMKRHWLKLPSWSSNWINGRKGIGAFLKISRSKTHNRANLHQYLHQTPLPKATGMCFWMGYWLISALKEVLYVVKSSRDIGFMIYVVTMDPYFSTNIPAVFLRFKESIGPLRVVK